MNPIPEALWGPDRSEEQERERKLKTALGGFLLGAVHDTCKPFEYEIQYEELAKATPEEDEDDER